MVTEAVDGDRLAWTVSTRCSGCDAATELCGWGEMPAIVRKALVARAGLVRLRVEPVAAGPLRVRLLSVFRKRGATIDEASSAITALITTGILGTQAEMRLLAEHLTAAGATVSREPHPSSR
ncbi:hypothetical protein GCM10022225_51350 [Plantactinospora mayteni]|uniref:Uncharacterized protein n=1 Tax=Plantactinospora mayteni TaxID=566021 RepID=A0ABQ4F465_9ACTN|nr:hypothetical protein Pma05_82580 [Plantactinospora mayteni]